MAVAGATAAVAALLVVVVGKVAGTALRPTMQGWKKPGPSSSLSCYKYLFQPHTSAWE
jgi:hypothetical protein